MSWKSDSERPEQEGCQFHIRVKPGDAAPYAVLPGDPARTDLIAQGWDDARLVANNREHRTFTGTLRGVPVTACSTGVGGPSASNAIEELARLGTHTFIRVGTCGALRAEIQPGDLIVNCAAIRHDGTSDLYAPAAYPAAASYDVTAALIEACDRLGYRCHVGVTCSTASFYAGQARPGFRVQDELHRTPDFRPDGHGRAELRDGGGHPVHPLLAFRPPKRLRLHGHRQPGNRPTDRNGH